MPALMVWLPRLIVKLSFKLKVKSVPPVRNLSSKLMLGGLVIAPPLVAANVTRGITPNALACGYHCPAVNPTAERRTLFSCDSSGYGCQASWLCRTPEVNSITIDGEKMCVQPAP